MTVSPDARTPSADLHALSGSSQPGSAATMQSFGVVASSSATVAELPGTFVTLGAAAADAVAGLAARRAAARHPDAEVIDLAGRVTALAKRESALWDRRSAVDDAVTREMPPRPVRPEMQNQMVSAVTMVDGARTVAVTEPAGWKEEHRACEAANAAAIAEHERLQAEVGARLGLPRWETLADRASARLARWGFRLAGLAPQTQAGLKAKATASNATVERGGLPDPWWQQLAASVSADALRIIEAEAEERFREDQARDGELFHLIARHGSALAAATEAEVILNEALARYNASAPKRPDAIVFQFDDPFDMPDGREKHLNGYRMVYTAADIEKIREAPRSLAFTSGSVDSEEGSGMAWRIDPRRVARKAAILDAFDAWQRDRAALAHQIGWTAANTEAKRLLDKARSIEDAILEIEVHTLAGIQAKALWIEQQGKVEEWSSFLLYDVIGLDDADALVADSDADPLIHMQGRVAALRQIVAQPATPKEACDDAMNELAALREVAFGLRARGLAGALASLEWARAEFGTGYVEGVDDPDWTDRFTLNMLDGALGVLRAEVGVVGPEATPVTDSEVTRAA